MVPVKDDTNEKTIVASDTTLKKELSKTDSSPPVLVVLIGPAGYQGKQWNLQDGFVIGRAIESNIFIDDKSLSRSHA
ncbi:MAG: GGDEF domain-containing protein, partial [Bdellovibrionaceae bacterium]|nr:GGDEF domain-containing protein [Pseudobdellovibrionaceae bacterium]